jgi:hypothetical protein
VLLRRHVLAGAAHGDDRRPRLPETNAGAGLVLPGVRLLSPCMKRRRRCATRSNNDVQKPLASASRTARAKVRHADASAEYRT